MTSQSSSDELTFLQPVLASLAQLIADGLSVDARQIEKLLRAADLDPDATRIQELARAVEILTDARQSADANARQVAVASLWLRGWLEAPARAAVFIAAGSLDEPQQPSGSGTLKVSPERLEWTLPVGQIATAQLQVVGGSGSVTCDSDQIAVTPAQFGSGTPALQVTVRPLAGSSLLWGNITLFTETDTINVPIVAQWESKAVVAGATPQNIQPPQTAVPSVSGPPAGQVQERATPKAQAAPARVVASSTLAPVKSAGSRRFAWAAALGVLAIVAGAFFLINNVRSRNASSSGTVTQLQPTMIIPAQTPTAQGQPAIATSRPASTAVQAEAVHPTDTPIRPTAAPPTATAVPATTVPTTTTQIPVPRFTVNQTINVHAGPGTEFPIIGQLEAGQSREINSKNNDGSWLEFGYNGQSGWIKQDLVSLNGDLGRVQVTKAIPQVPIPVGPTRITAANVDQIITLRTLSGQSPYDLDHMAIAPDGLTLATGSSNSASPAIRIWSVRDGRLLRTISTDQRAGPLAYSPDGSLLAAGMWDLSVRVWSVSDGRLMRTLTDHKTIPAALAFSPDGLYLASGGDYGGPGNGALIVWNVNNWSIAQQETGSWGAVPALAYSNTGAMLAAGMMDGKVRVFSTGTRGEIFRTGDAGKDVRGVALSPDEGRLIAYGGTDQLVTLMRGSDGSIERTLAGHSSFVNSIAFSPDGTLLAVGTEDGRIFLWRVSDGTTLRILIGHKQRIVDVGFTPDGAALASAAWDNTMRIWGIP